MSTAAHVLFPLASLVAVVAEPQQPADDDDLAAAPINEWTRTAAPASLTFTVTGPGGVSFTGTSAGLEVQETDLAVAVVVDLRTLQTGNAARDQLVREVYLEVEQHPVARLEVPRAEIIVPDAPPVDPPSRPAPDDAAGTLSLHGEQREIAFRYEATCNAAWLCDVVGDAVVVMTEFGIAVPRWQGALLHPEVKVHAEFQVQRTPAPLPPPDSEPEPPPTLPPAPTPT